MEDTYAPPGSYESGSDSVINAETMDIFRRTRGWTKFVGIFLMVIAILMIVAGIFVAIRYASMGATGAGTGVVVLGVYIVMAIFYIYPARRLLGYSKASRQFLSSGSDSDLCQALDQIQKFWRFMGVIMVVVLVVYALAFIVGILGAIFA